MTFFDRILKYRNCAPLLLAATFAVGAEAQQRTYDVVVVGAGSGGVSAAIAAARLGSKVALIEETDWIGGQMTAAAVSTMDEGHLNEESGLYGEFIGRVASHYKKIGKTIGTCYWSLRTHCFEPHVGQKILYEMIESVRPNVLDVMLRTTVKKVLSQGNVVIGIETSDGKVLNSKIVIDATEYGDLLPLAPVRYRVAKYTNENVDRNACVQDITYTAVVKKYPGGPPEELIIRKPPPGYTQEIRDHFARNIRKDGNPVDRTLPVSWPVHNAYRGVPDSSTKPNATGYDFEKITKTGINWFNDFRTNVSDWDTPEKRQQHHCAAKLRTIQFLYYMQTELGEKEWAIANDEGFDTPYNRESNMCSSIPAELKAVERQMPVMPYVRESRRLIGLQTLSSANLVRDGRPSAISLTNHRSVVGLGDYPMDLHHCNTEDTLELSLEREANRPRDFRFGLFQFVLEQFIPETADGFLVAEKNLSQSRYFSGATRLQPSTMLTGQAAGTIAGAAVRLNVPPRKLRAEVVQKQLLRDNNRLALPDLADVPRVHPLWGAVQLTVVNEWLPVVSSKPPAFPGEHQLIPGYISDFGFRETVTRRDAAVAVARRAKLTLGPAMNQAAFRDVDLFDNQARSVEALVRVGAAVPCAENTFCPDSPVTRGDFVRMLSKALNLPAGAIPASDRDSKPVFRAEAAEILWNTIDDLPRR